MIHWLIYIYNSSIDSIFHRIVITLFANYKEGQAVGTSKLYHKCLRSIHSLVIRRSDIWDIHFRYIHRGIYPTHVYAIGRTSSATSETRGELSAFIILPQNQVFCHGGTLISPWWYRLPGSQNMIAMKYNSYTISSKC